jgi:hypothetical protein
MVFRICFHIIRIIRIKVLLLNEILLNISTIELACLIQDLIEQRRFFKVFSGSAKEDVIDLLLAEDIFSYQS